MKARFVVALSFLAVALPIVASTKTVTVEVKGWTCASCASATRIALKRLDGVEAVKTDLDRKEAVVTYDDAKATITQITEAIEKLGYKTTVKGAASASSTQAASTPVAEPISFFEVPLECGAAEELGCGIRSKPILREIDKVSNVKAAKINRPGTVLAVVWSDPSNAPAGVPMVYAAFKKRDLETVVLRGSERTEAQRDFDKGRWYSAAEVDKLSEREGEIIATRLINRAKPRLNLTPSQLDALTKDLSKGITRVLTREMGDECAVDPTEELSQIASKHLNSQQLAELKKAADQGVGALPGEIK